VPPQHIRAGVPAGGVTSGLVFLIIAIVGTTIAPWQLFFQQSCVAEKRLRFADLKWARLDTLIAATFTVLVAGGNDVGWQLRLRTPSFLPEPSRSLRWHSGQSPAILYATACFC